MNPRFLISRGVPLFSLLALLFVLAAWSSGSIAPDEGDRAERRLATLYKHDPIATTLNFETGGYGGVIRDNKKYGGRAHIDFSSYHDGELKVGFQGNEKGVLIDLGTAEELKEKYGYSETVGGGQGFASIRFQGRTIVILREYKTGGVTPLKEAKALFEKPTDDSSHLPVQLGHIYLARITDGNDRNYEMVVKLIVVGYRPGESVTIRWDVL